MNEAITKYLGCSTKMKGNASSILYAIIYSYMPVEAMVAVIKIIKIIIITIAITVKIRTTNNYRGNNRGSYIGNIHQNGGYIFNNNNNNNVREPKTFRCAAVMNTKIHTINLSQTTFVTFINIATGKELVYLMDTGGEISILKENSDDFKYIQNKYIINIQGISQEVTKSKGLTSIEIQTSKYIIPHDYHIVHLQFAIPCDGILGID